MVTGTRPDNEIAQPETVLSESARPGAPSLRSHLRRDSLLYFDARVMAVISDTGKDFKYDELGFLVTAKEEMIKRSLRRLAQNGWLKWGRSEVSLTEKGRAMAEYLERASVAPKRWKERERLRLPKELEEVYFQGGFRTALSENQQAYLVLLRKAGGKAMKTDISRELDLVKYSRDSGALRGLQERGLVSVRNVSLMRQGVEKLAESYLVLNINGRSRIPIRKELLEAADNGGIVKSRLMDETAEMSCSALEQMLAELLRFGIISASIEKGNTTTYRLTEKGELLKAQYARQKENNKENGKALVVVELAQ